MRWLSALVLATALAGLAEGPASGGQRPLTASEFEAYVTGKVLYYGRDGEEYGVEEYLSGRRVRWSYLDGHCQEGVWYQDGEAICFVYERQPEPQCWLFGLGPGGLTARFLSDPLDSDIYETRQSDEPLDCLGPDVGV